MQPLVNTEEFHTDAPQVVHSSPRFRAAETGRFSRRSTGLRGTLYGVAVEEVAASSECTRTAGEASDVHLMEGSRCSRPGTKRKARRETSCGMASCLIRCPLPARCASWCARRE